MLTEFSHMRADMHAHSMNHEMYICCQNILSAWSEKLLHCMQLYTSCKTLIYIAACVCTCLFTCILLYQTVLSFFISACTDYFLWEGEIRKYQYMYLSLTLYVYTWCCVPWLNVQLLGSSDRSQCWHPHSCLWHSLQPNPTLAPGEREVKLTS